MSPVQSSPFTTLRIRIERLLQRAALARSRLVLGPLANNSRAGSERYPQLPLRTGMVMYFRNGRGHSDSTRMKEIVHSRVNFVVNEKSIVRAA